MFRPSHVHCDVKGLLRSLDSPILSCLVEDSTGRAQDEPRSITNAHYVRVTPDSFPESTLACISKDLTRTLLGPDATAEADLTALISDTMKFSETHNLSIQPWATTYGCHHYGSYVGQMGDGRAMSLAQIRNDDNTVTCELQLKGCGRTPFNRSFDGRCVLRSSVREFLAAEHLHHLGIPTSRIWGVIRTKEKVSRPWFDNTDQHVMMNEPGAVTLRVAHTFLRFGHLEYHNKNGEYGLLKQMTDYLLANIAPFTTLPKTNMPAADYTAMFERIVDMYAHLVAEWMRVGYVHGNVNSDNMALDGHTLDFGPFGFMEKYNPMWCPWLNTRHYSYKYQPIAMGVNIRTLSDPFAELVRREAKGAESRDKHLEEIDGLARGFPEAFKRKYDAVKCRKLGVSSAEDATKEQAVALYDKMLEQMDVDGADFTTYFRCLCGIGKTAGFALVKEAFEGNGIDADTDAWELLLAEHQAMSPSAEEMKQENPSIVLRNWMAREAYQAAEKGDYTVLASMSDALSTPYSDDHLTSPWYGPAPGWALQKPGVHVMTCSS